MYITIVGPGPQVSKIGTFSYSFMCFNKNSKRQDSNTKDVKKVIFHVKRK